MKLNVGCGTHYAPGWVNVDVWSDETTKPDVVVNPGEPYPFEDNSADYIYMGHVLEHIPWTGVGPFLMDIHRVAKPGAEVLIVGPDSWRVIQRWHLGLEPWIMVESVLEHQDHNFQPGREDKFWDGAFHHWNCHEQRVAELLPCYGFENVKSRFNDIPNDTAATSWVDGAGFKWPVVGKYFWQFALSATVTK